MTKEKNNRHLVDAFSVREIDALTVEMRKNKVGALLVAMNIVGIRELSEEKIVLISHFGKITVIGERLGLSVFENKSIEIFGRIMGVELGYGKNS